MFPENIPEQLEQQLNTTLERRERILWAGCPQPRFFTPAATTAFVFAIPWTAFAFFWIYGASGFRLPTFQKPEDFFPLFGLPFVLIGLGLLSAPLRARRRARNTVYAITNERILVIMQNRATTVRSYLPQNFLEITRKEYPDDSGTLTIHFQEQGQTSKHNKWLTLERISAVRHVEKQLKNLMDTAQSAESPRG